MPHCVGTPLMKMIELHKRCVYGLCCGSSGIFVQAEEFIKAYQAKLTGISIFWQESNYTTWRPARMNLAIRGIDGQIAHGYTFQNDRHPDFKTDYMLTNPPFNDSEWRGELLKVDKRWVYSSPPAGNANYAWVQHIVLPRAGGGARLPRVTHRAGAN